MSTNHPAGLLMSAKMSRLNLEAVRKNTSGNHCNGLHLILP